MDVKNPFSLYDFLGYLFPGALALFIIYSICKVSQEEIGVSLSVPFDYLEVFSDFLTNPQKKVDWTKVLFPFILVAYILGHLFSYLSSITIEYITNRMYMYPSKYLLNISDGKKPSERYWLKDSESHIFKRLLLIFLFALFSPIITIPMCSKLLYSYFTRPLETYLVYNINKKIEDLFNELNMENKLTGKDDFHRLVMHYVHLNIPASNRKADNYIALYGFLRSTTLVMVLFTDYLIVVGVTSICINCGQEFSLSSLILIACFWLISMISYMGFIKFYRRFTLENFMSLLVGKWHANV